MAESETDKMLRGTLRTLVPFLVLLLAEPLVGCAHSHQSGIVGQAERGTTSKVRASAVTQEVDPLPLIDGVSSICALGVPGPLLVTGPSVVPVVAGDEDTTPSNSIVVVASNFGTGRVVALGSDGFLLNEALSLFDNNRFGVNVVSWLDKSDTMNVLFISGHQELYAGSSSDNFRAELGSSGYVVTIYPGIVNAAVLSGVGVVVVGNACGEISQQEMDALEEYVAGGGGLLLIGLGWPWEPYNPGKTLEDYPMNKLGGIFGVRWINGYISDPTDNLNGQPIFHTFYPNIEVQTMYEAFAHIEEVTEAHLSDLPEFLQVNPGARRKYTNAHLLLADALQGLGGSSPQRQEIFDFYVHLVTTYPQYFRKSVVFDRETQSSIAWIRERSHRTLVDCLPLTGGTKNQIASSIGLTGWYLDIWNEFSVLLLDNTALSSGQLGFIHAYLNALPAELHNLRSIWVTGNLGTTDPQVSLFGAGSDINIFGTELGAIQGNEFPADVPPGYSDCFCITLVHEVNHIVHAYYICRNLSLLTRHDGLITRAGIDHMNYLRSMLPDGFFVSAPQEFFASTAHQWFTNSSLTLKLALTRFDNGYREPVNQFLLFAEVYSRGGDTTLFYTLDTQGNILRREVPIIRDESGRTTAVIDGQSMYTFSLDEGGHVTAYEISQAPPVLLTDLSVVSGVIRIDATLICPTAITRAEYAVDDTSSPVAIAPVDGVYDSADERIHIEIDVLSYVGLHRIYVRRYDYQGNPSDWLAVDFYVRDLAQRYNLISPKLTPLLGYSAGDLANAIGSSVTVVARWDPTIQGYVSFVPGFSGSELDFPVESEYGYFMYLTSPGKLVEVSSPGSPFSSGG